MMRLSCCSKNNKLDRDCEHARMGLCQVAFFRANSDAVNRLKWMSLANFWWGNQSMQESLNDTIERLPGPHHDPNSYEDRLALALDAQKAGDLEAAAVEYQEAIQLNTDPHTRKLLQKVREEIRTRNIKDGKRYRNDDYDEMIPILECLIKEQQGLHGHVADGENNFRTLEPLELAAIPDKKPNVSPRGGQLTQNMWLLAKAYMRKNRGSEAEFILKEMIRQDPSCVREIDGADEANTDGGFCPLFRLASVVARRGKTVESAIYYKYLVEKCLPLIDSPEFANNVADAAVLNGYIGVLRSLKMTTEVKGAEDLLKKRMLAHATSSGGDAFSSGGQAYRPTVDLNLP